jgi:hypothetical protein
VNSTTVSPPVFAHCFNRLSLYESLGFNNREPNGALNFYEREL